MEKAIPANESGAFVMLRLVKALVFSMKNLINLINYIQLILHDTDCKAFRFTLICDIFWCNFFVV